MPRYKDEPPAVRVYTVCDESKYLIVRNVPALGCGDQLFQLFSTYGEIEECKPMDAEDCEPFTEVFWIRFCRVDNARFAKRKLDESVFLGNKLQVSYAPQYESLHETKEKLEARRKEVLARLNSGRSKGSAIYRPDGFDKLSVASSPARLKSTAQSIGSYQRQSSNSQCKSLQDIQWFPITMVSSDKEYFPSQSMNQTVKLVREKLNKEPWLIGLLSFHAVFLLVCIVSRRNINFQMFLFLFALGGVYGAERLNRVLAANWKSFARQNYFDSHGIFLSTLWSGPLLIISIIILVNTLFSLCNLIVRWKKAELRHRARLASNKED